MLIYSLEMTHSEDIKRVSTPETIDFLNARVQALEKRVRLLEAKLEVEQERNLYNNL